MTNSPSPNFSRSFASLARRCICLFLLTLSIGNFSAHAGSECKDMKKKKVTVDGRSRKLCKYVRKDPAVRCNTTYEKIKTKTNKKGKTKETTKILDPKDLCTCTCAAYLAEELDPDVKICPDDLSSANERGGPACMRDGYEKGRQCSYKFAWRGCTYEALTCEAAKVCTCANDLAFPGDDMWSCNEISFLPCQQPPRGVPSTVPIESLEMRACTDGEEAPKDPNAEGSDRFLEIRRP